MIIKNVKVINPTHIIANANIYLTKNGKIRKVEKLKGTAKRLMIPGFIDLHIHGLKNHDVMDGKEAVQAISKHLAGYGTTSYLPTLMTATMPKILDALKAINNLKMVGSNILGFHLEGPFISKEKKGAHNSQLLLKPTIKHLDRLLEAANYKLKKIVMAPEVTDLKVLKYALKNNVIVAMGHSNAKGQIIDDFIKGGAQSVTHLWNGMSGFINRNPGLVQKTFTNKEIKAELICDLAHIDKETLLFTIKTKGADNIIAITDAIKPAKTNFKESISGGQVIIKDGKYIRVKSSMSIAGGNSVMYDNFKNLVKLGISLVDCVKMTSYNAAQELNVNKGEIKPTKDADLLILNENLTIEEIFIGGKKWKS